jgi:hypothetical protein
MGRQSLRERYLRDEWPRQLGNLASTLARLGARVEDPRHDPITSDLLREGALLMEWSAPHMPSHLVGNLAAMQRELCLWWQVWPMEAARPLLAFRAQAMSDQVLEWSGLVPQTKSHSSGN